MGGGAQGSGALGPWALEPGARLQSPRARKEPHKLKGPDVGALRARALRL